MAATSLGQIVAADKARLATISGLYVYDHWPASLNLPACLILPGEIDYRQAMKAGVLRFEIELRLLVGSSAGHEQQKTLWPYLEWATGSPSSVFRVLDADRTLGFTDVSTAVMSARPLGLEEVPEAAAFGMSMIQTVAVTNKE